MSTTAQTRTADLVPAPALPAGLLRIAAPLAAIGGFLCVLALFGADNRVRMAFGYLWAFSFVWTIVLGALFFVALNHLAHARWSIGIRRVAEMLAAPMSMLGVLFLPVVLFLLFNGTFHLYVWAGQAAGHGDHVLEAKRAYLNIPFFAVRAIAFFVIWAGFARFFINASLRQENGGDAVDLTLRMRRLSAPFMMLFAVSATFAGIDWLMSLNPRWFSTMFGVYIFAGMVLASLAAITLAVVVLRARRRLPAELVTPDHLYNLGALLFGFVCFWAYIAFSQYMLIWYGNMPEESFYIVHRLEGNWLKVSVALGLLRFIVPFLILLPRKAKMNPTVLFGVSILLLAGQLLDLYWLIMPEIHAENPVLGWPELAPVSFLSGALLWSIARFLGRHKVVAVGDPLLEESRRFHL